MRRVSDLTGWANARTWSAVLLCVAAICLSYGAGRTYAQAAAGDESARAALARGNQAMQSGDSSAAVTAFTEVTHDLPAFAEGYFNLGLALEQKGELDAADVALKRAVNLKPNLRGANLFRGIIAYREDRFKQAETFLARETQLNPSDAKAFMWLGVCRLAENNPRAAIEPLEKAHAIDPTDVDILYHRGHAYLELANESYEAMYKQDSDSARVHQVLAEAYAKGYRNQEAISEYELATKIAPAEPGVHEELADQYWIVGEIDKAAEAYREERKIDPYSISAAYKLGSLLVLHDQAQQGVQLLESALKADPSLSDAHYYLGTGMAALNNNDAAVREFESAIAADPKADRAMSSYYKLAQLYKKLHKTEEAKAALGNFQRMRADVKTRQETRTAEIVRSRTELPVVDPEKTIAAEN